MKLISSSNAKDYILNNLDQAEILARYLKIDISLINYCLKRTTNRISNPLRDDKNPSLGFKYYIRKDALKLITRDFANSYYCGDIFDIVGIVIGKNSHNPREFIEIVNDILRTQGNESKYSINLIKEKRKTTNNEIKKFDIESRPFNLNDYQYWINIGIIPEYIKKGKIIPVIRYWKNDYLDRYVHNDNDPCYCYYLGKKNDIDIVKLYFPKRSKNSKRFDTNCNTYLEAPHELTTKSNLIITKSRKDKLLMMRIVEELKLDVCITNVSGERVMSKELANTLKNIYENVFVIFDFDQQGIETMKEIYNQHELLHPSFPQVVNNEIGNRKDLTDYCFKEGYNKSKELFKLIYNDLIRLTYDKY